MNAPRNIHLLLIDPQNDFCDQPGAALPVAGACADLQRVAKLIAQHGKQLSKIHVTLDSHHPIDIAHPTWWQDAAGLSPAPFTLISESDVTTGVWAARDVNQQATSLAYVAALTRNNRYQLMIWPEHCLIGSWGHAVHGDVFSELNHWARRELKTINYVHKGSNPTTEHYSAICAEVPDPNDAATLPNAQWIAELAQADLILIAGQAISHCVAATVRDLADQLGEEHTHKLVLLTDCTSPVTGFAAQGEQFIAELTARSMQTASSLNFFD